MHSPLQDSVPIDMPSNRPLFNYEAKLVDVPFPFGVELRDGSDASHDQTILYFETDDSFDVMTDYYKNELVYLGWDHIITYFGESERLIAFEKPYKWLHIRMSASSYAQKCHITVFLAHKEYM